MNTLFLCRRLATLWILLLCVGLAHSVTAQLFKPARSFARSFAQPSRHGVHVANLRTGKMRFVGNFYDWAVSPDGRTIVGGRETGGEGGVYEVSVAPVRGGKSRRLTRFSFNAPAFGAGFKWSSDSRRVAIVTDRNDDGKNESQTFVVDPQPPTRNALLASKPLRRLSPAVARKLKKRFASVQDVTFSPDGRWVAASCSKGFYQNRDFQGGIFVFRPDGSQITRVTRNVAIQLKDADDREVRWLPNGHELVFRRTSYEDEGI